MAVERSFNLTNRPGHTAVFRSGDGLHAVTAAIRNVDSSISCDFDVAVNAAAAIGYGSIDRYRAAEGQTSVIAARTESCHACLCAIINGVAFIDGVTQR